MEKYKSMKSDYMIRSPKRKWLFVLKMGIVAQKSIGIAILDPNFEVWWYTYASGIAFLDVILSFLYTLWYYADRPLKGLLFTALFGVVIPVRNQNSNYYHRISNSN